MVPFRLPRRLTVIALVNSDAYTESLEPGA
jgi:hypothetical protein